MTERGALEVTFVKLFVVRDTSHPELALFLREFRRPHFPHVLLRRELPVSIRAIHHTRELEMRWKAIACISILAFVLAGSVGAQTRDENWARCMDQNSPDLAIGACTAIIQSGQETSANLAIAFNNRGAAYNDKGEYDRAIQDLDQAIRLNPNYAMAFNNRGIAYDGKKEYDHAIRDYDQAIRLNPNLAQAFNNRGAAYYRKKEYDRAIQDYDQAIRLNPNYAQAFTFHRGLAHLKIKQFEAAITDYDAALKVSPKLASSLYGRGLAERAQGKRRKGDRDVAAAKQIDPKIASEFESY